MVLIGLRDGAATVLDTFTGKQLLEVDCMPHINRVRFSPGNKMILIESLDKTGHLFNTSLGAKVLEIQIPDQATPGIVVPYNSMMYIDSLMICIEYSYKNTRLC